MYLRKLKINNFRKFQNLKVEFTKGLNLLVGENDAGKTAIVDAIKYVLNTQSLDYIRPSYEDFFNSSGPFEILCQLGKIKNTKGHEYENRDRCRAIC